MPTLGDTINFGDTLTYPIVHDDGGQLARIILFDPKDTRGGDVKMSAEVRWDAQPDPGIVWHGWIALEGTTTKTARDLAGIRTELSQKDWAQLLGRATFDAKQRYRKGEPFQRIGDEPVPESYVLRPMVVASGPTVICGPGGTGKSLFALAAALTVATGSTKFLGMKPLVTGPVLYLDWEDVINTQNERAHALCRAAGFQLPRERLIYQRMRSPLPVAVKSVVAKIAELSEKPVMLVVDSVSKARGGNPNDAGETNALFAAIDQLGLPSLCIDHKSRDAIENNKAGPVGSLATWNNARAVWDLIAHTNAGDPEIRLVGSHSKGNSSEKHPRRAWIVDFSNREVGEHRLMDEVRWTSIPPSQVTALRQRDDQTVADRIFTHLEQINQPSTVNDIAAAVESSQGTVRAILNRHSDLFAKTQRGEWVAAQEAMRQAALPDPF